MYVTRPLSFYTKSPNLMSEEPLEGPYSGYLAVHDDDESITPTCFGISGGVSIKGFPLPSNKLISLGYAGVHKEIFAIPVINQPLSSNRYYLIKARGKHKGEAYTSSKEEEDKGVSCGRTYIKERKPGALDPKDIYQQFTMSWSNTQGFSIKPIASDAHLPNFLKTKSLSLRTSNGVFQQEANGLDSLLRAKHPDFNFPLSRESSSSVCVGKWLCPFMFVHEGKLVDQVNNSLCYSISLEQRWQRIFTHDASDTYSLGNKVMMDVVIPTQVVAVYGKDAIIDEKRSEPKVTWFTPIGNEGASVGLSCLIVERMGWEQKRVGWVSRKERQTRVVGEEEYGGIGWWAKYGCYVLVERFVVRRGDGTLVFTCEFMHTHKIKTKWE